MSELKVEKNMTLQKFRIIPYIRYSKTKFLNQTIVFWMMNRLHRFKLSAVKI